MFNLQVVYIVECSKKLCTEYLLLSECKFSVFLNQPESAKSVSFCVSGQLFQVGRSCVLCFRCCVSGVFRVSAFGGGCIFCVSGVKSPESAKSVSFCVSAFLS